MGWDICRQHENCAELYANILFVNKIPMKNFITLGQPPSWGLEHRKRKQKKENPKK
jgi:hypothetical protein